MAPPIPPTPRRALPGGPWKHGALPVLGLIGEIGGGKSRAAAMLAERGAFVIDADAVGHAVLRRRGVRDRLVARFGARILDRSPTGAGAPPIDRRALGAIVFADPEARRDLEAVVHPRMRRTFERAIIWAERRGQARAVVLDAAILLEAGWGDLCDRVLFVEAPRDQRLARLAAQRGWSEEVLEARERAQWPSDEKRRRADAVVANDSGPEQLEGGIEHLWSTLLSLSTQPDSSPMADRAGPRGPDERGALTPEHSPPRDPTFSEPADEPRRR